MPINTPANPPLGNSPQPLAARFTNPENDPEKLETLGSILEGVREGDLTFEEAQDQIKEAVPEFSYVAEWMAESSGGAETIKSALGWLRILVSIGLLMVQLSTTDQVHLEPEERTKIANEVAEKVDEPAERDSSEIQRLVDEKVQEAMEDQSDTTETDQTTNRTETDRDTTQRGGSN
jgi:hypothetical protein